MEDKNSQEIEIDNNNKEEETLLQNEPDDYLDLTAYFKVTGAYGRFQVIALIVLALIYTTYDGIAYPVMYYELYPDYFCNPASAGNMYVTCDKDYLYENPDIPYIVNWGSDISLLNWVAPLDLTFKAPFLIGLLGSFYFMGWAISSLFLPRLSDLHGRKY